MGRPPSVTCSTLTEEAVQQVIAESETLRRWIELDCDGPLGDAPRVCSASLSWLGSDDKEIDAPADIEFTYWPPRSQARGKKKRRPDGAREMSKAVRSTVPAVADMAVKVAHEGHVPVEAAMKLANRALDLLEKAQERDARRVDSAITEMANRANGAAAQPAPSSGGFKTLIEILSVAKEAKSFLN
jgi:hypothetical protein